MVRLIVLALLLTVRTAFAQLSVEDLKDDIKRLDQRTLVSYNRALETRDFFANIHDSIWHRAYKDVKAAHAKYMTARAAFDKSLAASETGKASKQYDELERLAEDLGTKLEIYTASSANAVEKIQIGLGVFAFLICGIGYLIFRRRKR